MIVGKIEFAPALLYAYSAGRQMEWQPIETAPKGKSVLLYCNKDIPIYCGRKRYGAYGEPLQDSFEWRCDSSGRYATPKYWMPLPEAPTVK